MSRDYQTPDGRAWRIATAPPTRAADSTEQDSYQLLIDNLIERSAQIRPTPWGPSETLCPGAHETRARLMFAGTTDGTLFLHCAGGCDRAAIERAFGLPAGALGADPGPEVLTEVMERQRAHGLSYGLHKLFHDRSSTSASIVAVGTNLSTVKRGLAASDTPGKTSLTGAIGGDYMAHVQGLRRVGAIPFVDETRVGWGCIDLDLVKWDVDPDSPEAWKMINAIIEQLALLGIRTALERSKGKGWHVWTFLDEPVPAAALRAVLRPVALAAGARDESDLVCPRGDERGDCGNGTWLPVFGGDIAPKTRFYTFDADSGDWTEADDQAAFLLALASDPTPSAAILEAAAKTEQPKAENAKTEQPKAENAKTSSNGHPCDWIVAELRGREIELEGIAYGRDKIQFACPVHVAEEQRPRGGSAVTWSDGHGHCSSTRCGVKWRTLGDLVGLIRGNGDARGETADATTEEWSTPVEWAQETTGPALALEALPPVVREYVEAVAESVQISPDFVAASALGVLAAAAGRRMEVAIGETHCEPLNLYMFPTLGPGERKVAIRRVAAPLYEAEEQLAHAVTPEALRVAEQRAVAEMRIAQLRKEAAKSNDPGLRGEKIEEAARVQEETPDALYPVRLAIDDATTEATARVLGEQGGVLSVVSEEAGSLFEVLAGKYSKGDAVSLDLHLKSYDGGLVRVNRIGREPILIPSACLSILATPQPSLLSRIGEQRDFRGRGLIGRCCFVLPASRVGTRKYQDCPIPESLEEGWRNLVLSIATRPIAPAGEVPAAPITGEALDEWARLADTIEGEQRDGSRLAGVRDWASKHAGRVARLAGLLHLVRYQDVPDPAEIPIDLEDVAAAGVLGEWLLEHALVAFGRLAATPSDDLARKLLAWLRRSREVAFTSRDAHRAHQDGTTADEIRGALGVLADRGFIRRKPDEDRAGKPGRRPAAAWDVNPMILEGRK